MTQDKDPLEKFKDDVELMTLDEIQTIIDSRVSDTAEVPRP